MYNYRGFGLDISSEIEIPELMLSVNENLKTNNLLIKLGKTPNKLIGENVVRKVRNWAGNNEFLLEVPNLVRYHTFGGNTIVIQPLATKELDWQSIRIFLLGTVIASILHQKGYVPLHASAIAFKQELVLFCGNSGVGKSTTASFLKKRGYTLFSDDICLIKPKEIKNGVVYAHPTYPMVRLWSDTITKLKDKKVIAAERVRPGIDKFKNYFREDFDNKPLPIRSIVVLGINNENNFKQNIINSIPEKMLYLKKQTFRKSIVKRMEGQANLFYSLTKVASSVPMMRVSRPETYSNINAYIDFIEDGFIRS